MASDREKLETETLGQLAGSECRTVSMRRISITTR